ncbi:hypothetical protein FOZ61_007682 [Perkinsus olseni]|uniref:Uncharacterized protein n=1 Tax=Perkinsus olseni TaxID=32597 RepID=A0A7J6LDG5_PEROL|nr:hypothetical protein FOZ61_007682 [Perkinsus olseni]KAF4657284.1 hypothetical protein FOL46_007487 [Perkinsus olseni]
MTITLLSPVSALVIAVRASDTTDNAFDFTVDVGSVSVRMTQASYPDVSITLTCDSKSLGGSSTIFSTSKTTYSTRIPVPMKDFFPDGKHAVDPFTIPSFRKEVNKLCGEGSIPDNY